jgi:nucleoside-diphosphate-sugar epimerase
MGEGSNHAIVFGASGLIGWALVDQLLSPYPHSGSFSKVTAVTNRALSRSKTYWPESESHRPDLQLVSGIDLRHGDGATLAHSLKQAVKDVESVTHIYYVGMSPLQYHYADTHTYYFKFLPQLTITSRRSQPTSVCCRMSLTPTDCSVPTCSSSHFQVVHG